RQGSESAIGPAVVLESQTHRHSVSISSPRAANGTHNGCPDGRRMACPRGADRPSRSRASRGTTGDKLYAHNRGMARQGEVSEDPLPSELNGTNRWRASLIV